MKRITCRLAAALLTFMLGIASVTVWLFRVSPPVTIKDTPIITDSGNDLAPEMAEALSSIPAQESLVERLNIFTAYQRARRWDKVAELLGEFKGVPSRDPFTDEQKGALIARLREKPILGFRPQCTIYSTETIGKPFEERWWSIKGVVESAEGGLRVETGGEIIAYRHKGSWFFYPTGGDASGCRK